MSIISLPNFSEYRMAYLNVKTLGNTDTKAAFCIFPRCVKFAQADCPKDKSSKAVWLIVLTITPPESRGPYYKILKDARNRSNISRNKPELPTTHQATPTHFFNLCVVKDAEIYRIFRHRLSANLLKVNINLFHNLHLTKILFSKVISVRQTRLLSSRAAPTSNAQLMILLEACAEVKSWL